MSWEPCGTRPGTGLAPCAGGRPTSARAAEVQEYRADFAVAGHELEAASLARRPDAITLDMLEVPCVGPARLADPSEGLLNRVWKVSAREPGVVRLSRSSVSVAESLAGVVGVWEPETELFRYDGAALEEVDLGFDQNGNVVVCAERQGRIWLYWFDPRVGGYTFADLCAGRTPRVLLDDAEDTIESDLLLFYALPDGSAIQMRQQRELYDTVHPTPAVGEDLRCEEVARASDYRLRLYYSRHDAASGTYELVVVESAPYPVREVDVWRQAYAALGLTQTEYVLPAGWAEEIQAQTRARSLLLVDLVLRVGPDATDDASLASERWESVQRARSVTVSDLVLRLDADIDRWSRSDRAQLARVTTHVLVGETVIDSFRASHQATTIQLAAV